MKTFVAILMAAVLVGCRHTAAPSSPQSDTVRSTGPVTMAISTFDYHETLRRPDGTEFEFDHARVQTALFEEGAVVDIQYIGSGEDFATKIVGVKVIRHSARYVKEHPELWPLRKGHWERDSYVLDDGSREVCGTAQDLADVERGYAADCDTPPARESVYQNYATKEAARLRVQDACK